MRGVNAPYNPSRFNEMRLTSLNLVSHSSSAASQIGRKDEADKKEKKEIDKGREGIRCRRGGGKKYRRRLPRMGRITRDNDNESDNREQEREVGKTGGESEGNNGG